MCVIFYFVRTLWLEWEDKGGVKEGQGATGVEEAWRVDEWARREVAGPICPCMKPTIGIDNLFGRKKWVLFKDPLTGLFTVQTCISSQTALNQNKSSGET